MCVLINFNCFTPVGKAVHVYTYLPLPVLHLSYRWSCTISWVRTMSPSTQSSSPAPCWALTIISQSLTTCQLQVREHIDLQVQII